MLQKLPESILAVAYHRRFYNRPHGLFSEQQPQLLSSPIVMYLPLMPTGRRIYEEVWSMANVLLKNPKKISLPWWQNPDWEKILDQKKDKGMLEPFVLKYVDHSGYSCSLCAF